MLHTGTEYVSVYLLGGVRMYTLTFILGGLFGVLLGVAIGFIGSGTAEKFYEYKKFLKQQEFEKEKYYSEYASKHQGKGV